MFQSQQWINWVLQDRPGDPKPAKMPCVSVNDYANFRAYDIVRAIDPEHIGFVLTEYDPYFCIDLDHAWNGSAWSPLAQQIVAMFPGAYMEISYSGDGLHIIGQGRLPAGYKTRGPGVECYTHSRFIAITGTNAQGSPDIDFTASLASFAPLFLKPDVDDPGVSGEWTTAPVAEHTPIESDDELIRKMVTGKQSAGVIWGGKASAWQLWNGDVEALSAAFPTTDPGKQFDRSSADAALAGHLLFWTGKDCARTERLMRQSALVREKWDRRGDNYLRRTIAGAAAKVQRVYQKPSKTATDENNPVAVPQDARAGLQYMDVTGQMRHFAGCVYIVHSHRVMIPNGMLLKPEQFKALKGGFEFQVDLNGGRPIKNAFEAFTESRAINFPKAHMTCFRPELPAGTIIEEDGITMANAYVPPVITMTDGDVSPWLELMGKLLPNETDRQIVISYLAAILQYPGVKFRWCPLIQGAQGNGKGAIMMVAEYLVGKKYFHKPNAKQLNDSGLKFTGWMERKLLILIEEVYVADRRELIDALKPLITDDNIEFQSKGVDQTTGENKANFILTSNHRDAIALSQDDRRYAPFFTAQQSRADMIRDGLDGLYLPKFYAWLKTGGFAAVAGWLNRYQIPPALNPATECHRAPVTSSTYAAIEESRGVAEQEILAAIEEGRPGFCGGWVSSVALTRLLSEIKRTVAPRKRGAMMATLGYIPHPKLPPAGQAPRAIIQEEMKRPVLYVRQDMDELCNLWEPKDILHNYMIAQGYSP